MTDFLLITIFRIAAIFLTAWLVMLLLPSAGAPALGFDQVVAGVLVFGLLAEFAVDINKSIDDL